VLPDGFARFIPQDFRAGLLLDFHGLEGLTMSSEECIFCISWMSTARQSRSLTGALHELQNTYQR
jgi:hypothetical protein